MEITSAVAGSPCYAPAASDGPSVEGYPKLGAWAGGEISHTQPVASRPILQRGDDAQDDAEIGGLEKQIAAQQREIRELRHEQRAERQDDDGDRWGDNDADRDGRRCAEPFEQRDPIARPYAPGQARPL